MAKSIIIIGSGFAGLSSACFMAKAGWQVTVIEKNGTPGGRARCLQQQGFSFDMGPSWYWMPEVFEKFFSSFNRAAGDFYQLRRLDPSYRIYWHDGYTDLPADLEALKDLVEQMEPGGAKQLDKYLEEAEFKYRLGMQKLVYKPGLSFTEFFDRDIIRGLFKLDVFSSMEQHIKKYFRHPRLRQMMSFPVLFLGAMPEKIPALYSLMNYADMKGGTWYPMGGMYAVVKAMHRLAIELGVQFVFNEEVQTLKVEGHSVKQVITPGNDYRTDAVISTADYHHTETALLSPEYKSYQAAYWNKRVLAPSCLLYYVGLKKKLKNVSHHSLFFDTSFNEHAKEIYKHPSWPTEPLFYTSIPSVTDDSVAPPGGENMFCLIPVASGLQKDTQKLRDEYFSKITLRMEKHFGQSFVDSRIYQHTFSVSDFSKEYHSFRGNAYGLANTIWQTAILKPCCKSKKIKNLFYAGQFTVPGPGVPPALISGEVAANEVVRSFC